MSNQMSERTELEICQDRLDTAHTVENTLSMTISMLLAEIEDKDAQIERLQQANQKLSMAQGPVCPTCGPSTCRCEIAATD